jgi:hypothetical protein
MYGFGARCPLVGIERGGFVGPHLISSPGTPFELLLQRTRNRAPDELRPLAATAWRDALQQRRGLVVELDEQLFHMNDHIIIHQPFEPVVGERGEPDADVVAGAARLRRSDPAVPRV